MCACGHDTRQSFASFHISTEFNRCSRFAAQSRDTQPDSPTGRLCFYPLTFTWEYVDRCIYNSSRLINGTLEVSDMQTNEVLLPKACALEEIMG